MAGWSFILENQTKTTLIERRIDPFAVIHRRLGDDQPLNLDDLSWPTEEQLNEPPLGYFETCSQLFVLGLRRLPNGADCLRALVLDQAAQHLNWQTAFLKAFARHFPTLRDADKWWGVQVAGFTGRNTSQTYTLKESWQRLEAILAAPVSIHVHTNRMPERAVVPLQTVLSDWDFGRQKILLRQKIAQLRSVRVRMAPDLVRLTDDYRLALENYVDRQTRAGVAPDARGAMADSPRLVVRKTMERLNVLDILRGDLKVATLAEAPRVP
jgi:hypothetical protein